MRSHSRVIIFLVILIALSACSNQGIQPTEITVEDAWARPGVADGNSAVYFVIDNPSTQADILINAEADIAEFVEIHRTSMDAEGNMRMQQQDNVPVEAGSRVEFAPGGLHIMLIQLEQDLSVGDTFPVTLHFENQGPIQIQAIVNQP
jgi:periplasmic copper chaperone A